MTTEGSIKDFYAYMDMASTTTTTSTSKRWKFCPECGVRLGKKWKFCSDCGTEVGSWSFMGPITPYYVPYTVPYYPQRGYEIITWCGGTGTPSRDTTSSAVQV